jgi:hypothetical protein
LVFQYTTTSKYGQYPLGRLFPQKTTLMCFLCIQLGCFEVFRTISHNVLICLRHCGLQSDASPNRGFAGTAEASFPQERGHGWQNVPEQRRGDGTWRAPDPVAVMKMRLNLERRAQNRLFLRRGRYGGGAPVDWVLFFWFFWGWVDGWVERKTRSGWSVGTAHYARLPLLQTPAHFRYHTFGKKGA